MLTQNTDNEILTTEKLLSYITIFVILLVPTIGITEIQAKFQLTELTFYWPWLIIQQYAPEAQFDTFQYNFIKIPWSLFLFIPFLYAIKSAYNLYHSDLTNRIKHSSYIVIASVLQILLIGMTYSSNTGLSYSGLEQNRIYYLPQFILIILHGYFAAKWFYKDVNQSLQKSKNNKSEIDNSSSS